MPYFRHLLLPISLAKEIVAFSHKECFFLNLKCRSMKKSAMKKSAFLVYFSTN